MAKLLFNNSEIDLKLIKSNIGPNAIDIRALYKNTGLFTYDPGFMSTATCSSTITFIDGNKGILRYRGYNTTELATKYDFLSVAYLLLHGDLPNESDYSKFTKDIATHSTLLVPNVIQSFSKASHPMSIVIAAFSALSSAYNAQNNVDYRIIAIAQIPSIVATIYRHINNLELIESDNTLGYVENFFYMMFGDKKQAEVLVRSLGIIFTLHADHEQNASTATVRMTASSGANPFACLAAGSATLSGPAHGGANEAVIKMLNAIENIKNVPNFIQQVKSKETRLMGFGHRVYKNYDPRATMLRDICYQVLDACKSKDNNLLEIALELENIALKDEYFLERKLYPNVDFYSGLILKAMGIPTNMFTTLFALARTTGWVTQLHEMINDQEQKISRPRQVYVGNTLRTTEE